MMIIAFCKKTSKILPRIVCRHFRHCAPIVHSGAELIMYQFVRHGNIAHITLRPRDIQLLRRSGWVFIYISANPPHNFNPNAARTCVDLTKHAMGIRRRMIQTPDALYKLVTQVHCHDPCTIRLP